MSLMVDDVAPVTDWRQSDAGCRLLGEEEIDLVSGGVFVMVGSSAVATGPFTSTTSYATTFSIQSGSSSAAYGVTYSSASASGPGATAKAYITSLAIGF